MQCNYSRGGGRYKKKRKIEIIKKKTFKKIKTYSRGPLRRHSLLLYMSKIIVYLFYLILTKFIEKGLNIKLVSQNCLIACFIEPVDAHAFF